jgi:hypothetical protein
MAKPLEIRQLIVEMKGVCFRHIEVRAKLTVLAKSKTNMALSVNPSVCTRENRFRQHSQN